MDTVTTACLTCGNTVFKDSQRLLLRPTGPRQESAVFLYDKASQLAQLIKSLQNERVSLLQELNCIQSPVMSLPNETLSIIFEHACLPHDLSPQPEDRPVNHFRFIIAAVCSHWRNVAHGTPGLWSSVALYITPYNTRKKVEILEGIWSLVKTSPLALSLHFSHNFVFAPLALFTPSVDPVIIQALPRIRELYLVRPCRLWFQHFPSLSHLETVSLTLDLVTESDNYAIEFSEHAPLRNLSIERSPQFEGREIVSKAPWSAITSLNFVHVRISSALRIMRYCPSLVQFRLTNNASDRRAGPPNDPVTLNAPVVFPNLEVFELSSADADWSDVLAQHIHFPLLKELKWQRNLPTGLDSGMQALFARLPSSVTIVDLSCPDLSYVHDNPNIEELRVAIDRIGDMDRFLQQLKPRPAPSGELANTFPKVKRFVLYRKPAQLLLRFDPLAPGYSQLLLDILEERLDCGDVTAFCLEMDCFEIKWLPEVQTRLKELVEDGLDLKIVDSSEKAANWL
ncbi:hypothetical protein D9756_004377 [Leucocoprinus leucothites]|uniref:F-box domain-containing protein n=1 Tax=Leucocoprinus leucothites TaxID=201217 RepID=A0A8H5DAX3_9AGAR|nr:hypothetical protein D9756_004377 [Leucoagaricus leucothites]